MAAVVATPLVLTASPALAAAPANDLLAGATPITVGVSAEADTTMATTDSDDAQANQTCGAPATDASVWYSFTAASDGNVIVDVASSSYTAGVIVATGTTGNLFTQTCGPGSASFQATAGTTYSIMAFDDQFDGGGNGGTLRISVAKAPSAATISTTIDSGRVNSGTGSVSLSGTFTCTDGDFISLNGQVSQTVGRLNTISGFFNIFLSGPTCDGSPQPWTADVKPSEGKFAGGRTAVSLSGFACGPAGCGFSSTEQVLQLKGGKK